MAARTSAPWRTPDAPPAVSLAQARFGWRDATVPVIDIEHLQIAARERVFLQGPSGSGKTTLLNLIAGMILLQAGELRVQNTNPAALNASQRDRFRADHIGFIFQQFNLIPYLSVLENVCLPCGFSRQRMHKAQSQGGSVAQEAVRLLTRLKMADPDLLSRPVTALSVGQQQRVAAARALIGAPSLVIADEPTSALDAARRDEFLTLLLQECDAAEAALLFVSHDAALASHFHRTLILDDLNRASGRQVP